MMLSFDNRLLNELPGDPIQGAQLRQVQGALWSRVAATPVSAPRLVAWSPEMAATLGLTAADMQSDAMLQALSGNGLLPGMQHYATCYGGHQFGNWAGQLGDGRAIFLGETVSAAGERWELQLKGAGATPYSRRADGRAVLRSSLREFLCSEAMFHLGIPTTRALSLVTTGDTVIRDMFYDGHPEREPGAIVCRVAPSFIRFGHFELPASRGDIDLLRRLTEFTMQRDFADMAFPGDMPLHERVPIWFGEICRRTALLMAEWMRVGFVHGVMNTDNMSILGLTIDYGPYGWIDNFDPGWTPNTTDASGRRYCFGRQPDIARWNLERLAEALALLLPEPAPLVESLGIFDSTYGQAWSQGLAAKFGLSDWQDDDAALMSEIFELMTRAEVDMTMFFRLLGDMDMQSPNAEALRAAFYREELWQDFHLPLYSWLQRYGERLKHDNLPQTARRTAMHKVNPRFVLRNYLAQQAIDQATEGDTTILQQLFSAMRQPYDDLPQHAPLYALRPDWARQKAGCSMLSCSS
ncbi:YdiU family protein [Methylovorus menthalis]|nr:YdiU family protein [Methylovorus menthalis]MCB4810025.1 YdiU family protein [Methylovorus menthalis]